MDRRRGWLFAGGVAVAAGVTATAVGVWLFPFHSVNHDEGVYLAQAAMLLEGQLFLDPPLPDLFRPWFFVERPDGLLYPKYAPVPAATFALGWLAGSPRLGLVGVTVAVAVGTYALAATLFDRRRGVVAALLLFASPLFLLHSGVFLPYAPTTVWNLLFAYAYVRADRDRSPRLAAVAGVAVGVAFFSRPYTAVAFAAPFVVHAVWSLRARADGAPLHRPTVGRQTLTAVGGLLGVAAALGYNAAATGSPLVFPYQAFAPADGIGFGHREILGYDRTYTPALALRANAEVVWRLFTRWVPAGAVGTLAAVAGLWQLRGDRDRVGTHRRLLAATVPSVVAANVAFWGNLNLLGDLALPADGLIASLGPYYHYDLIVPTAVFAAVGLVGLRNRAAAVADAGPRGRQAVAGLLAVAVVVAGAAAAAPPVARNADATQTYRSAYVPFTDAGDGDAVGDWATGVETANTDGVAPFDRVGRPALTTPADAVVLVPRPFGDWLAHPYQPLRNDPGFDAPTLYALDDEPFAVADAFPGRTLYRYVSRGAWEPQIGDRVAARLQRVHERTGERVNLTAELGVPRAPSSVSVRLAGADGQAYYAATPADGALNLTVTVTADGEGDDATVGLAGPVERVGEGVVAVDGRETVTLTVFVDYGTGSGVSYRLRLPVAVADDRVRAVTPALSACTRPTECGEEAGYVPRATEPGVRIDARLAAGNESVAA
ncbi:ArnT family glycosyltransferase [Halobaculum sp. MBLA0143]|uniref:ArnT family glycosyltransferase n=1 Tax=Halobaculum sp. MBLA0143 TaxID=3079933 RepID=UPI003524538A